MAIELSDKDKQFVNRLQKLTSTTFIVMSLVGFFVLGVTINMGIQSLKINVMNEQELTIEGWKARFAKEQFATDKERKLAEGQISMLEDFSNFQKAVSDGLVKINQIGLSTIWGFTLAFLLITRRLVSIINKSQT